MGSLRERVFKRWAGELVPLPLRRTGPKAPQITIGGQKYALSTDSGPLAGDLEELAEHPRIRTPQGNKWKFLWAYDTDRQIMAMWRASDGNEKVYGPARSEMNQIIKLDKKGQLNRVTSQEFDRIESAMKKAERENLRSLEEWVKELETEYQRDVNREAQVYFDHYVRPKIDRAVRDVEAGATPIGYKPYGPSTRSTQKNMVYHVTSQIINRDFTLDKLEAHLRKKGLDPNEPHRDIQAAYWALNDVIEAVWKEYL